MSVISGVSVKLPCWKSLLYFLKMKNVCSIQKIMNSAPKSSSVDVIDAFTYEVLNNKNDAWKLSNQQNIKNKDLVFRPVKNLQNFRVKNLHILEVDNLIMEAISDQRLRDINHIILECSESQKCPSLDVLVELFSIYSTLGDIKTVKSLRDLCFIVNNNIYVGNGEFGHFMAKAYCYKGNLDKGMGLFLSVYENTPRLRGSIDSILKSLIWDVVINGSEASMVILRRNLEEFIEKWGHFFPMTCFWRSCWLSTWFMHQKLSDEIFDKYEPVRNMITNKIFIVSLVLLKQGNEDAITRLLQMLLRHELTDSYIIVLQILFDYRLDNGNYRGCNEIMRNCRVLGLSLGPDYNQKYLFMIIDGKGCVKPETKKLPNVNSFKMKF